VAARAGYRLIRGGFTCLLAKSADITAAAAGGGMSGTTRIVVVEDDAVQRELLADHLTCRGFAVTGLADGPALRRAVAEHPPDLVLLDVKLPGEDGFSLARYLRERWPRVGIIMVTIAADTFDRVAGLEIGADDYILKPFDPRELLARVKSLLRRIGSAPAVAEADTVRVGRCLLDRTRRLLLNEDGAEERLTASEYDLLRVLVENPNRPLTRDLLLEATSHRDMDSFDRAIDLRIMRLRRKVEGDPAHPETIRTVRWVGYMFVPGGTGARRSKA
jgi:DNA-binding response OmpR family regulator